MQEHDHQRLSLALHEAAHAVVAIVQGCPILDCVLEPDDDIGRVNFPAFYPEGKSEAELRKHAVAALAGWAAQLRYEPDLNAELFAPSIRTDTDAARRMAIASGAVAPEAQNQKLDEWRTDAAEMVGTHWEAIERVAHALIEQPNRKADDIARLVQRRND